MNNIVDDLIKHPFALRCHAEKLAIISRGRPTPELPDLIQKVRNFTRHFGVVNYKRANWLTGSAEKSRLFCWNCLLFSKDRSGKWVTCGQSRLSNLCKFIEVHEKSIRHIRATIALSTFGYEQIKIDQDTQTKQDISAHNSKVKRNRDILVRLVNVLAFMAKQDLPVPNENSSNSDRSIYAELFRYTSQYDTLLMEHLSTATVFEGLSDRIQNELVDAVAHGLTSKIKAEIIASPFVALIIVEATDVTYKSQFSLAFRYTSGGFVIERFLCFVDVDSIEKASAFGNQIISLIRDLGCDKKIVSQTYDGVAVLASYLNATQALINESFSRVILVHSYTHSLNSVLSQSISSIPNCRVFFASLNSLAAFFSRCPKRTAFLEQFLDRRLAGVYLTKWDYSSGVVNTIYRTRESIRDALALLLDHCDEVETSILEPVQGLLANIQDFEFCFLLALFYRIFSFTSILCSSLRNDLLNIPRCENMLSKTIDTIDKIRNIFEDVYEETLCEVGPPRYARKLSHSQDLKEHFRSLFVRTVNSIQEQLTTRLQDINKLTFLSLLEPTKYENYNDKFPDEAFKCLLEMYGHYFDKPRLKNELIVMYSSEHFQGKTASDILLLLSKTPLGKAMSQLLALASLITTLPLSPVSDEKLLPVIERIKKYSIHSAGLCKSSHLGLISIESKLLSDLKDVPPFLETVVQHFAKGDHLKDFIFKDLVTNVEEEN